VFPIRLDARGQQRRSLEENPGKHFYFKFNGRFIRFFFQSLGQAGQARRTGAGDRNSCELPTGQHRLFHVCSGFGCSGGDRHEINAGVPAASTFIAGPIYDRLTRGVGMDGRHGGLFMPTVLPITSTTGAMHLVVQLAQEIS
jgi:hypothetical protein